MESRAFHRFSQVPLRHIVTSLILFIILNIHTPNMHTHTPSGCQGTPQQSITTGAQKGEGDRWMAGWIQEGQVNLKCSTDVPSALYDALEWALCPLSSIYGPLFDLSHPYSTQKYSITELFVNQVYFLNSLSNVAQDNRLWGTMKMSQYHLDIVSFVFITKGRKREELAQNGASCFMD